MDTDLERLAAAHGVATSYDDQLRRPVPVSPESVVAVLAALGVDASSAAAVRAALDDVDRGPRTPPCVTLRPGRGALVPVEGSAELQFEDGTTRPVPVVSGTASLPAGLPLGGHVLRHGDATTPVLVAPDRVPDPAGGRQWGWMLQLYAARSARSWGVGDLADLATVTRWTAARGGGLVLVNPLHATVLPSPGQDAAIQPSPYYPASRRWTNPLFLHVEDLPEYAAAPPDVRAAVDALRPAGDRDRIDRDTAWAAKGRALQLLWEGSRESAPAVEALDHDLRDYATWAALTERHGGDWRAWPESLRRPTAPGVAAAREKLADGVRFHAWMQQRCADQLRTVQQAARRDGMPVGVVHDLAVGTDPGGADAWALQDALALGARIGAPPDTFNQQGQDWGMPPWHPRRLAELGYAPLRAMLRAQLAVGGGVRIDHILGLFRLWWIPAEGTARDGTYVSYDAEAMLGVVALEAARAGALVVGEDLGTVPPAVRDALADRGVFGSSVLWFEREEEAADPGQPAPLRPLESWREHAMASVSTHDLPTALGWLRGEHVQVRGELGLLDDVDAEWTSWRRERDEIVSLLQDARLVGDDPTEDELVRALHVALTVTPSRYVVAAPGDVIGDLRQPNLPGTVDEYPSWRLPVADADGTPLLLDDLLADVRVERLADELTAALRPRVGDGATDGTR